MHSTPNHDKDERRRKILLANSLYALLGYCIPLAAVLMARTFDLATYSYVRIVHLAAGVLASSLFFWVLIATRKRVSPIFANGVYLAQFLVWLALHAYVVSFLGEIRVTGLFFAFIALVFLLSNARFGTSLTLTLAAVVSYTSASWYGIERLGQPGTLRLEVFHALVFLPIGAFIALVSEQFHRQREDVKRARREAETTHQELAAKNAMLVGLSSKLSKYLSPQVYNSIFTGKRDVKRESSRKKLTVFFSDIKGFTELTDSMEPETLSAVLNHYLNEMASIGLRHGGTIDKFIGDAVMVFFGDPETRGEREDAVACVEMALEMRARIHDLQRTWLEKGISTALQVRMGITTGYCTVGNFGSEERMDYTIIGGEVNLASRLESRAEPDQILMSHATYNLVKDHVRCVKKGDVTLKGMAYPVAAYEPIASLAAEARETRRIDESHEGFSLSIDFERVAGEDRARAMAALERATERLRRELARTPGTPRVEVQGAHLSGEPR